MQIRWYGPTLILLLTVGGVMLVGPRLARQLIWSHTDAHISQVRNELESNPGLSALSDSFAKVSAVVEPSVVHIQILGEGAGTHGFFNRFDPLEQLGNGSGWVYRHESPDDGSGEADHDYIITNHHVVADAEQLRVRFADGSEHTATLVGTDPLTEVAVLKVRESHLHPAEISTQDVSKGQIVFAFGSPFRFDFSVSQGIVSAVGRRLDVSGSGKYENFIQTDAAINPGNSGGPLTDIYGRVVGMNTAIAYSGTGDRSTERVGWQGVGFAIPVSMVVDTAEKLITEGEVRRGYLGVFIRDLTPSLAAAFHFSGDGVLVEHPIAGGPADSTDLLPGDIVTHIADEPIANVDELRYRIASYAPGSQIQFTIVRDGSPLDRTVTLGELPEDASPRLAPRFTFTPTASSSDDRLRSFGIERFAEITDDQTRDMGYAPLSGVMILEVRVSSIAWGQKLGRGVIITHVGDTPVDSVAELRRALDEHDPLQPLLLTTQLWTPELDQYVTRYALLELPHD